MKLMTSVNSIAHDVSDMCQTYTQERLSEAMSLIINNSTLYTVEGLVSRQTIALALTKGVHASCIMRYWTHFSIGINWVIVGQ